MESVSSDIVKFRNLNLTNDTTRNKWVTYNGSTIQFLTLNLLLMQCSAQSVVLLQNFS